MYIEELVGVVYYMDMGEGDHSAELLLLDDQVVLDQGCSIDSTSYSSPSCNISCLRFLISSGMKCRSWSSKLNWTVSKRVIRPRRFLAKISLDLASTLIEGISLPLSLRRYQSLIERVSPGNGPINPVESVEIVQLSLGKCPRHTD